MYSTTTPRNQRTPLVTRPAPKDLWSALDGNDHVAQRDASPFRRSQSFFKFLFPVADGGAAYDPASGEAHFYIEPGRRICTKGRRIFSTLKADLAKPQKFPARIEIEFSSPHGPPLPKSYKSSAIAWALSVCDTVLLCIDQEPGTAKGEAHRVMAPLQVVFRCREEHVPEWVEYLKPRLHGRHRLSVVHIAAGRA